MQLLYLFVEDLFNKADSGFDDHMTLLY
jgi:hypothetical protein